MPTTIPSDPLTDDAQPSQAARPSAGYSRLGPGIAITITPRTLWLALGIILLAAGLVLVLVKAIYVVILLFIAIIFAEGLRPVVDWLHRRLRVPRPLAVFALYLLILLVLCVLGFLLVRPFAGQVTAFITDFPAIESKAGALLTQLQRLTGNNPQINAIASTAKSQLGGVVAKVLPLLIDIPLLIGQLIFSAVIVIVMAFFWLTGVERLKPFVVSLFPQSAQPMASGVLTTMSERVGGYLRGVLVNMVVIGMISGFGDWLLQAPYPVLLGIVAGLTELLPYIGPWISGGVAVLVSLLLLGPLKAIEVVGLYLIIQEIEGHTLLPVVMMKAVKLNPLTVIVSVLVGAELLGIVGGILAVPAAAILHVLVAEVAGPVARHAARQPRAT